MKTREQMREQAKEEELAMKENRNRYNTLKRRIRTKRLGDGLNVVRYELELLKDSESAMKSMTDTFDLSRDEVISAYLEIINE